MVSIVIPVRNERKSIAASLGALLSQDYPRDRYEIIVADASTDGTRDCIAEIVGGAGTRVTVVDNPDRIASSGLNRAIAFAAGDIVVRVDGHTVVSSDYVRQCVAALERTNADNVGGRMTAVADNRFGRAVALATSSPFGVGGARFHYSDREEWVDTVYMGAWRRDVFERIGLFDEELVRNQDDEFNYRLRAAGGRILLSPRIRSRYYNRSTPKSLWQQYFEYGFWKVRCLQKHPRQMQMRQFVPGAFVAALILSAVATTLPGGGALPLIALVGAYALANLGASLWTSKKAGAKYLALLPFVFAVLHIGYGMGSLMGLARFWNRWGKQVTQRRTAAGSGGEA